MAAKLAGSGGENRHQVEQNADINVTPFVDVMLVLLIIFMVAAPLATVSVELKLPDAVAKPHPNPPKPVYISIQAGGSYYVGDKPTTLADIGDDLKAATGTRDPSKERIFIRADKQVRYGDFMKVMNALQDANFYSVALVGTDNSGPGKGK